MDHVNNIAQNSVFISYLFSSRPFINWISVYYLFKENLISLKIKCGGEKKLAFNVHKVYRALFML